MEFLTWTNAAAFLVGVAAYLCGHFVGRHYGKLEGIREGISFKASGQNFWPPRLEEWPNPPMPVKVVGPKLEALFQGIANHESCLQVTDPVAADSWHKARRDAEDEMAGYGGQREEPQRFVDTRGLTVGKWTSVPIPGGDSEPDTGVGTLRVISVKDGSITYGIDPERNQNKP